MRSYFQKVFLTSVGVLVPSSTFAQRVSEIVSQPPASTSVLLLPTSSMPRYPESLRAAGIPGDVLVTFVVDTLGVAEQGSVRVLRASHDLFASAVADNVADMRFRPAVSGGRPVRRQVQFTVIFNLTGTPRKGAAQMRETKLVTDSALDQATAGIVELLPNLVVRARAP
jgi:TonB family protein